MQQQPVDETHGLPQRLGEIDEQHHARVRRAVPGLVLVGVVEDHGFAFTPVVDVLLDADAELPARLRHDQAETEPQHAIVRPAMRRQICLPGSRIENIAVIRPGMFWQTRHVSGHTLILLAEQEP